MCVYLKQDSRHLFELPEARGPLRQKPEIQKSECQHDHLDVPLALTDCWKVGDHTGSMWIYGSLLKKLLVNPSFLCMHLQGPLSSPDRSQTERHYNAKEHTSSMIRLVLQVCFSISCALV